MSGNKPGGYHQRRVAGKLHYVHRLAYAEAHGLLIEDVPPLLRHTCDNSRCINAKHLIPGTHQDNADDKARRRRCSFIKLSEDAVREIKATCQPSRVGDNSPNPFGYSALARRFGVTAGAVRQAFLGKAHKFV
ncbi:MAG: hypothetical protein ACK57J_20070 [Rubrivivax sp.]